MMFDELVRRTGKLLEDLAVMYHGQSKSDLLNHSFDSAFALAHQAAAVDEAHRRFLMLVEKLKKEAANA